MFRQCLGLETVPKRFRNGSETIPTRQEDFEDYVFTRGTSSGTTGSFVVGQLSEAWDEETPRLKKTVKNPSYPIY
jgi:hypothetical protein